MSHDGPAARLVRALPFVGLVLSGAAGLVYEVVWSRAAAALSGTVVTATGLLLALFMAGLGVGSALGGRWAARARRPLVAFGLVEIAVGLLAAATPSLLEAAAPLVARLDVHLPAPLAPLVPAVVSALVLGPVVVLLGITFPLFLAHAERERGPAERDRRAGLRPQHPRSGRRHRGRGLPARAVARHRGSLLAAAAVDLGVGVACVALGLGGDASVPSPAPAGPPAAADRGQLALAVTVAALGGAASLILEVAWFRALMLFFGSSVHALSLMLAAFLIGLAGGAVAAGRGSDRAADRLGRLGTLHLLIGFAATMVTVVLQLVPALYIPLLRSSGGGFTLLALELAAHPGPAPARPDPADGRRLAARDQGRRPLGRKPRRGGERPGCTPPPPSARRSARWPLDSCCAGWACAARWR